MGDLECQYFDDWVQRCYLPKAQSENPDQIEAPECILHVWLSEVCCSIGGLN